MLPTLARDMNAPLPLTRALAMQRAVELRRKHHLSYPAIARVVGEYHGVWLSEGVFRRECVLRGEPTNPKKYRPGTRA